MQRLTNRSFAGLYAIVQMCLLMMAGSAPAGGYYSDVVLSDQPFAYYQFDDASSGDGDTAMDATGLYDGTYVGAPSLVKDTPEKIGGTSLEIVRGATDSYVTAPLTPLGSLLGEGFSFEFWIKTTDTATRKRIFGTFNDGSNTSVTVASNSGPNYQETVGSTQIFMRKEGNGSYSAAFDQSVVDIYDGNWHHVVWTAENMASPGADPYRVYIDGLQVPLTYGATWSTAEFVDFDNPFYIVQSGRGSPFGNAAMEGQLDEFAVYDSVLTEEQILAHYQAALTDPVRAMNPAPGAGETDVLVDVLLSWRPGVSAVAHDVYLGTVFADVNEASRSNPLGVLVSEGQEAIVYDPSPLEFGETYYWRIDEVNASPDSTIFRGAVWSFTVEPIALPLAGECITATALSSSTAEEGPENTVNGSGLDDEDLHSVEPTDMWLSGVMPAGESAWIEYEFDRVYALHEMLVWNHNTATEGLIGLGIAEATIEYSVDGQTWVPLGDGRALARGTGKADYAANTAVDFGGVTAKYVRITAVHNWGGVLDQYGLSEVRFLYLPMWAREPDPDSGATEVDPQQILSWRAGRQATSHEVYFGTSEQAVADGTVLAEVVTQPSYDPGALDLGQKYYWKINELHEVAELMPWEGDLWQFSTKEFLSIEDFESYTDDMEAGEAIFQTWIDGVENETGSFVGYEVSSGGTFGERQIVHGGQQSMPLEYNNTESPWYSEAERIFDTPQDLTMYGADTLRLYFQGRPAGFLELASGDIVMSAVGTDIFGTSDEFRFLHKQVSGNATIVARVWSLDNTHPWAKAGVMIREGVGDDSRHAMMLVSPGNGVSFQRRVLAGDSTTYDAVEAVQAPQWLQLTRSGDVFTAQYSADGATWQNITATDEAGNPIDISIPMTDPVYIGLALTSHNADTVAVAQFADVSTTGNVSGDWETSEVGVEHPSNTPESLYVALEDSTGTSHMVSHPDPAATVLTGWQEWPIPLADFEDAGVRLDRVQAMSIVVGDPEGSAAGGSGLIYVDDIQFGHVFAPAAPDEPNVTPSGAYDAAVLADDPYAYYRFEDGSSSDGDIAADTMGLHDGTYAGSPNLVSDAPDGIGGTSLGIILGEIDSYVSAPLTTLGGVLGQGVSFEFWIKTTDQRTRKRIFGTFNNGANTSVTVASNAGPAYEEIVGSTQLFMRRQGGGDYSAAFDQSVADIYDGNWHHVVWVAENMASPGPDPYTLYVDGTPVPLTYGAMWTTAEFADFDNPLYIGSAGRGSPFGGATLEGQLDEFAVYDSVLTQAQVTAHYER